MPVTSKPLPGKEKEETLESAAALFLNIFLSKSSCFVRISSSFPFFLSVSFCLFLPSLFFKVLFNIHVELPSLSCQLLFFLINHSFPGSVHCLILLSLDLEVSQRMSPMGDNDRHHQQHHASSGSIVSDNKDAKRDGTQLLTSVNNLIQDFRKHSFRSKSYSASGKCFILLVDLLDKYYQSNGTRESVGDATSSTVSSSAYQDVKVVLSVKRSIISFLLSFRANSWVK